jgi:uncharacterized protein YkwD
LLEKHNLFRQMEGLSLLVESETLNKIAYKHAKRMARLTHLSDSKLKEYKNDKYEKLDWNITVGSNSESIIKKLINDPVSRNKVLGEYNHLGYGYYKGRNDVIYWAILYGRLRK